MANQPVRDVFANALECASEQERQAYLDRACAGSPELRKRVEHLLRAYEKPGRVLDKPAPDLLASVPDPNLTADHVPAAETPSDPDRTTPADSKRFLEQKSKGPAPAEKGRVGEIVGGYELVRLLGAGGMGVVYLGEKRDGKEVHRVAIKLIKPDRVNPHLVARFRAERRILTRLNHGNIAKVFDMGVHVADNPADGGAAIQEPYFVMEYVADKDFTLDRYCTDHKVSIPDRLALFEGICRGVDHAHSSNVIHRDLKGGNILIAVPKDGRPVPKVIDFGLAKAFEDEPDAEAGLTSPGSFMGTPDYMSPEQASGEAGIGPRTDVYALGVILYRLLTGVVPIDVRKAANHFEMVRLIREEIPEPPSAKVKKQGSARVAEERRIEPSKLPSLLRGDLDWVVKKALEKDPANRYATAGALGDEVRRFLDGVPVEAGPAGRGPRMKKFVRRNRALVTAGSVVFVTLVLGVVGLVVGLVQVNAAKIEAENAQKIERKALEISWSGIRAQVRAGETLDESRQEIYRNMLKGLMVISREKPGASRTLRETGAETTFRIANIAALLRFKEAESYYGEAIAKYESLNADFPDTPVYMNELAACHFDRAHLYRATQRTDEAVADFRVAGRLHEDVIALVTDEAAYRRTAADAWNDLGVTLMESNKLPPAEAALRSAVEQGDKAVSLDASRPSYRLHLAMGFHNLGNCIRDQGKPKESIEFYNKAIERLRPLAANKPDDGKIKEAANVLVGTLWDRAHAEGWLKNYDKAFADWDEAYRRNEPFQFFPVDQLGSFRAAAAIEKKHQGRIPAGEAYSAAKIHARAYKAAKDTGERTLSEYSAKRVFELLTQAKGAGWFRDEKNVAAFKADADFAELPKELRAAVLAEPPAPKK